MTEKITNKNINEITKPKKLFNKNYFLLWQGQTVSRLGSQMYYMAMIIWITSQTDSASMLALLGIMGAIPALLLTSIGGTFADRYSRKKIIILSDLLKGLAILSLAYLFYYHSTSTKLIITWLLIVVAFTNSIQSFFAPAISASVPELVPKDKLTTANSLGQASVQITQILGWSLSSTLYFLIGIPLLTLINGLTFLFSAFSETFIKIPQKIKRKNTGENIVQTTFKSEFKEGLKYVWKDNGLKKLIFASVVITFFSTPIILLLPFFLEVVLNLNKSYLGLFYSVNAVGILLGSVLASFLNSKNGSKSQTIVLFMILNAVTPILLGLTSNVILSSVFLFFSGLWAGFIQVNINTILQLRTDSSIRGRVFGVIGTLAGISTPIAMAAFGIIADVTNKNIPLIYSVSGIAMLIITIIVWFSKDIRNFLTITKEELLELNTPKN